MVVDFVVLGRNQETSGQENGHDSWTHRLDISVVLGSFVEEISVQQFDGDVSSLISLGELFAHIEKSLNERGSLIHVHFGNARLCILDIVVKFVSGFVLEHLGEQLCWRNVSVELLTFLFDCGTLILKDHGSAPLAIFEFDVVSDQRLTIDESSSQIVGLVEVLRIWHQG